MECACYYCGRHTKSACYFAMHTVELRNRAITFAKGQGYRIREEWLEGKGGGLCEFGGHHWIFVDLSLSTLEQLAQVMEVLQAEAAQSGKASGDLEEFLRQQAA